MVAKTLPVETLFPLFCCGPAKNRQDFSFSLEVLAAPFPVHYADYETALPHWPNATIVVTNDKSTKHEEFLLENSVFYEDPRKGFVDKIW